MNPKKTAVLVILAAAVSAFFVFDLGQYFSLAYIKQSQSSFTSYYEQRPVLVTAIFFAV